MKKHMGMFLLAVMVVAVLLISTVGYKLEFTEYALIKRFGRTMTWLDGSKDAGLHFKWPWPVEKLVKYDARMSVFEDTHSEVPTRDKQNVLVTMYCAWEIADPVKFHSRIELPDAAQERIRTLLRSHKKQVINTHNMEDLINTDPEAMRIPDIEEKIFREVREKAREDYGVNVVRVGIRNLGLPRNVSAAVIEAMKEERGRFIRRYEAEGDAKATAIRERAKADRDQIIAFATRKAQNIRSEGDQAAAEYYAKFNENSGLSMFLRSLESLKKELKSRTVILLDHTQNPAVNFFREGPSLIDTPTHPGAPVSSGKRDKVGARRK